VAGAIIIMTGKTIIITLSYCYKYHNSVYQYGFLYFLLCYSMLPG